MTVARRYEAFIIGGGAAGSEAAFRLAEAGIKVGLAERGELGGECNHYGCVPTKVMLRAAHRAFEAREADRFGVNGCSAEVDLAAVQARARSVIQEMSGEGAAPFERAGITVLPVEARIIGDSSVELADGTRFSCDRIILATGTRPEVPDIQGLADEPYWTNKEAVWAPTEVPSSLAIVGTGAIGTEFAQIFARFGAHVSMFEVAERFMPSEDADVGDVARTVLENEGVDVHVNTRLEHAVRDVKAWTLHWRGGEVRTQEVLVATGRQPVLDGHDLRSAGVELDADGKPILDETLRTTRSNIWVIGDATGELLFTHVATYEAQIVARDILGEPVQKDYRVVPRVTFSSPEIASVGLTEEAAREEGLEIASATARAEDVDRSIIDGDPTGLVKLIAARDTGEIVGGHVVMPNAGLMIHEICALMGSRMPVREASTLMHAYPTRSEAVGTALRELAT